MGDTTTIPIDKSTRDRLGEAGTKNQTWDEIVNRLLDEVEADT